MHDSWLIKSDKFLSSCLLGNNAASLLPERKGTHFHVRRHISMTPPHLRASARYGCGHRLGLGGGGPNQIGLKKRVRRSIKDLGRDGTEIKEGGGREVGWRVEGGEEGTGEAVGHET